MCNLMLVFLFSFFFLFVCVFFFFFLLSFCALFSFSYGNAKLLFVTGNLITKCRQYVLLILKGYTNSRYRFSLPSSLAIYRSNF